MRCLNNEQKGGQAGSAGTTSQGYLSLANLSTSPPQVCTGVGATIEQSQNEAAISALKFLSDMGLESKSPVKSEIQTPVNNSKTSNRHHPLSNGGTPATPTNSNTPTTPSTPLTHNTPNAKNKNQTPRPHPAPVK
ncbi:hypothetical protein WDU94_004295 [Cyamophila willieti]